MYSHLPWGSQWGSLLPLTGHHRITLRCGGSEDPLGKQSFHLVSGEQQMLPRRPQDECRGLPSCWIFHQDHRLGPPVLCLAQLCGKGCSGARGVVLGGTPGQSAAPSPLFCLMEQEGRAPSPQDPWSVPSSPLAGALWPPGVICPYKRVWPWLGAAEAC